MSKRKNKKATGRRRRRRNPRTLAPGLPGRQPTPKEVFAAVHEALLESRARLEGPGTEAEVGAPLKDYFLRVVASLEEMMKMALVNPSAIPLFVQTAAVFLPVLNMEWLPEDPQSFTRELTEPEQEFLDTLRTSGPGPDQPRGHWTALLDLITESVAVFVQFGYSDGLVQCYALNEALLVQAGEPPAPLEP